MTDRGVSVALNYVLSLAITTLLISGLLFATGDVVGDRRESIVRGEMQIVGERVSAGLAMADRLARTGAMDVSVEVSAPPRVAGDPYSIELDAARREVVLTTADGSVSVGVPVKNETALAASTANGGRVEVVLTAAGELEVRST